MNLYYLTLYKNKPTNSFELIGFVLQLVHLYYIITLIAINKIGELVFL